MISKLSKFIVLICLLFIFTANYVNAGFIDTDGQDAIMEQEESLWSESSYGFGQSVGGMAATIIKALISLLGVIFIILIIYAGYNWMTAGGNEEKVQQAKKTITRAAIGLLIITAAYAITYFVFSGLPWGSGSYSGGGI